MSLSSEFTARIDRCDCSDLLKKELNTIYHILYRNRDNVEIRLEMIEKINYITKRINDIKCP